MNDNSDNKKNIVETSCGQELSKRRRKRDLSINDVAREIKIESSVIKKIESDEFHSIGAPVFVKGYLRQYSSLVGADDGLIIKKYNELNPEQDTLPIVNDPASQISKFIVTPKSLLLGLFGLILLLILTFFVITIIDKEEDSVLSTNEIPVTETEDLTELNSLEPLLNITIFYNGLC